MLTLLIHLGYLTYKEESQTVRIPNEEVRKEFEQLLTRKRAIVVELKWNKAAGGALEQIKNNHYAAALIPYVGRILLVGINYNEKTGDHSCVIERV